MTALEEGDRNVGRLAVRTYHGVQAMNYNEAWVRKPSDPQNNVYCRSAGSPTFLNNGDNRGIDFTPWLRQAVRDGWRPDIWLKIMGWPRDVIERVE